MSPLAGQSPEGIQKGCPAQGLLLLVSDPTVSPNWLKTARIVIKVYWCKILEKINKEACFIIYSRIRKLGDWTNVDMYTIVLYTLYSWQVIRHGSWTNKFVYGCHIMVSWDDWAIDEHSAQWISLGWSQRRHITCMIGSSLQPESFVQMLQNAQTLK